MKYYLAVFSSITYANKIKKVLENQLGFVSLMHSPVILSENGCSYCLRFKSEMLEKVLDAAKKNDIKIKNIYVENNNEYIKL